MILFCIDRKVCYGGITLKRRNGFTLIELLAIIIILAIIAVITVPIVLNIIDDSQKNVAIDSAYLYRDALNKFYLNKVMNDKNYDIDDGEYDISYFVNEGLDVSGKKPSAGWVLLENSEVTDFSFKIGDYAVTYVLSTDTIEAVKDGELALTPTQTKVQIYLTSLKQANSTATDIFNLPVEGVSNGDITDGWVALNNGDVIGYSLNVGDKSFSLSNKNDSIGYIITSLASIYISGLTTPNSETIVDVTESGKLNGGFIEYKSINSTISINDYSLEYEIDGITKYANLIDGELIVQDVRKNRPIYAGDTVYIGNEGFYVMSVSNGRATILANTCLRDDNGTWRQVVDNEGCNTRVFSDTNYWHDTTNSVLKDEYKKDVNGNSGAKYSGKPYPYVYYIAENSSDSNNISDIVDDYVATLSSTATGRLLTYEEAMALDETVRSISKYYWLGSAYSSKIVFAITTSGKANNASINGQGNYNSIYASFGVRPVIEISVSEIQ